LIERRRRASEERGSPEREEREKETERKLKAWNYLPRQILCVYENVCSF
jgi:hypothetical protein